MSSPFFIPFLFLCGFGSIISSFLFTPLDVCVRFGSYMYLSGDDMFLLQNGMALLETTCFCFKLAGFLSKERRVMFGHIPLFSFFP